MPRLSTLTPPAGMRAWLRLPPASGPTNKMTGAPESPSALSVQAPVKIAGPVGAFGLAPGWASGRREPYTERGITRKACVRCGTPALFQWQVCADNRLFRPLCLDCDIALNRLVLRWARDPDWRMKCKKYEKQKRAEYSPNIKDQPAAGQAQPKQ